MSRSSSVVKANDEVIGVDIRNNVDEHLGCVKELMLDKVSGRVAYVVLESGGFLGLGGKLFALPWSSLRYDINQECFIVNLDKQRFENAPGFDKDNWPDMADRTWGTKVASYYGTKPHWEL